MQSSLWREGSLLELGIRFRLVLMLLCALLILALLDLVFWRFDLADLDELSQ